MWRFFLLCILPAAALGAAAAALTQPAAEMETFVSDRLSLEIRPGQGDSYTGVIHKGASQFPFTCLRAGDRLTGTFQSDGHAFEFSVAIEGNMLTLESGGATYRMSRMFPAATAPSSRPTRPAGLLLRNTRVTDPMTGADAATLLVPDGWKCGIEAVWRQNPFDPATIAGSVSDPIAPTAFWMYQRLSFIDPAGKSALPLQNGASYMGSEIHARFSTPAEFVLHCLIPRFRGDIVNPQVVFENDLPELARDQTLKFQSVAGVQVKSSRLRISYRAGGKLIDEDFICTIGSVPVSGQMTAWGAECESYRASQGRLDRLMPLLRSIASSVKIELDWFNCVTQVGQMMQQDAQDSSTNPAALAHCIERTNNQISDAIRKSYEARARIEARCNDDLNRLVTGLAIYRDRDRQLPLPTDCDQAYLNADEDVVLAQNDNSDAKEFSEGWHKLSRASQ